MTSNGTKTITMDSDDPLAMAMRDIQPAFMSAAMRLGTPAALEGLGNLLIMNLATLLWREGGDENVARHCRKCGTGRS